MRRRGKTRSDTEPARSDSGVRHATPTLVGFEKGQTLWIGALYEFTTATGQYVYLHEMECVGMGYMPLHRRFVLTFECVSSALMPPSTVLLSFDDAEIYQWETDLRGAGPTATNTRLRGRVSSLHCLEDDHLGVSFHLVLFDVSVSFFASRVTCEVRSQATRQ